MRWLSRETRGDGSRKKRGRRRKRRLDSCALRSSLLSPLSLSAFRRSVSRRPNKPLMRNGCYSCPPRYFCAITIYHICLYTHSHTRPLFSRFFFFLSLSPFFIFTPLVKQEEEEKEEEVAAIDTTSGVSTYPVPRVSSTFRPNQPPRITSGAVVP